MSNFWPKPRMLNIWAPPSADIQQGIIFQKIWTYEYLGTTICWYSTRNNFSENMNIWIFGHQWKCICIGILQNLETFFCGRILWYVFALIFYFWVLQILSLLSKENTPIFCEKNASKMGKTNFTLGPTPNFIIFSCYNGLSLSKIHHFKNLLMPISKPSW